MDDFVCKFKFFIEVKSNQGDDDLTLNDLIIDPSINIEGDYMDKEEIKDINGVINLLNSKDKCLFNLYFRDGYSQIEISNILGLSQSYISRRIKMLVDKLEELLYQKNIIVKSKVKTKSIGYNKKIVM